VRIQSILSLPAFNPGPYTGQGNNTYLIAGREPLLVDAGVGDPRHLDAIAAALAGAPLARVLVTHNHSDHIKGIEAVAVRWPEAVLLKKSLPERDQKYAVRWTPVRDRDEVPAGDIRLRIFETPGHAPDHLCLFDETSRVLFAGDLLMRRGTVVIPPTHGGSLGQYLRSLEKMLALLPSRVLPAHGPPFDDAEEVIHRYLAHRLERQAQIVRALEEGAGDLDEVLSRVYVGLRGEMVGAARETILAHLIKLEEEGRAARDGEGRWTLRDIAH
jgi:glyoxylase-like metal-dependent hydrolase (beta-lactamase superfamily II)